MPPLPVQATRVLSFSNLCRDRAADLYGTLFESLTARDRKFGLGEVEHFSKRCRLEAFVDLKVGAEAADFEFSLELYASDHGDDAPIKQARAAPKLRTFAPNERAFTNTLCFVLHCVTLEGEKGLEAAVAERTAQVSVLTHEHVMREERSRSVESEDEMRDARAALVARLRPVCAPLSAMQRVLLAIAYTRDSFHHHCAAFHPPPPPPQFLRPPQSNTAPHALPCPPPIAHLVFFSSPQVLCAASCTAKRWKPRWRAGARRRRAVGAAAAAAAAAGQQRRRRRWRHSMRWDRTSAAETFAATSS
jgi:hypothetical protein